MKRFHLCFYTRHVEHVVQQCISKIKAMLRQKVLAVVFEPITESNYKMLVSITFT